MALAELRFWSSDEYKKYTEAYCAFMDAAMELQDELKKLEPVVNTVLSKLDEDDADGLALCTVADNAYDLSWRIADRALELWLAIG